jgi:hypothetical protein
MRHVILFFDTEKQVGVAHAREAASHGVSRPDEPTSAGPGGLRAFGGAASSAGGGLPATASVIRAAEHRDAVSRTELFARPSRSEANVGSQNDYLSVPGRAPTAVEAVSVEKDAQDASDYDYASAFAAMGGNDEDDSEDASHGSQSKEASAGGVSGNVALPEVSPGVTATTGSEDDLGLL